MNIFLSYRKNSSAETAYIVKTVLEKAGHHVFLDDQSLRAGPWPQQLHNEVKSCDIFIPILGKRTWDKFHDASYSASSDWVLIENLYAMLYGKCIIPIFEDSNHRCVPSKVPNQAFTVKISAENTRDISIFELLTFIYDRHGISYNFNSKDYLPQNLNRLLKVARNPSDENQEHSTRKGPIVLDFIKTLGSVIDLANAGLDVFCNGRALIQRVTNIVEGESFGTSIQHSRDEIISNPNEIPTPHLNHEMLLLVDAIVAKIGFNSESSKRLTIGERMPDDELDAMFDGLQESPKSEILAYFDATEWDYGYGFAIAKNGIWFRDCDCPLCFCDWTQLENLQWDSSSIYINGYEISTTLNDEDENEKLLDFIIECKSRIPNLDTIVP